MYRIDELKPRNNAYVLDKFLRMLERAERAMSALIEYLDDPDEYVALDEEANDKLARVKKHVPGWDDLSSEEKVKQSQP